MHKSRRRLLAILAATSVVTGIVWACLGRWQPAAAAAAGAAVQLSLLRPRMPSLIPRRWRRPIVIARVRWPHG